MAFFLADDRGNAVRQIQQILRDLAFRNTGIASVAVDGFYDEATKQALRRFQGEYGLPPNGVVDYRTWLALQGMRRQMEPWLRPSVYGKLFPDVEEYIPSSGADDFIRILQIMLRELSRVYDISGELPLDGIYRGRTEEAVREFQSRSRLPADGRLTVETRRRIAEEYGRLAEEHN